MGEGQDARRGWAIAALIGAAACAAYARVLGSAFLTWDDANYVTANPHVLPGITMDGILWAFTTTRGSNWHPLTWLSHMLDCTLFGARPAFHHLVSVLIHAATSILLFRVLARMTSAPRRSALTASSRSIRFMSSRSHGSPSARTF
jgi:hypothetical protein